MAQTGKAITPRATATPQGGQGGLILAIWTQLTAGRLVRRKIDSALQGLTFPRTLAADEIMT